MLANEMTSHSVSFYIIFWVDEEKFYLNVILKYSLIL
jgi:hypothetical protein